MLESQPETGLVFLFLNQEFQNSKELILDADSYN